MLEGLTTLIHTSSHSRSGKNILFRTFRFLLARAMILVMVVFAGAALAATFLVQAFAAAFVISLECYDGTWRFLHHERRRAVV